MKHHGRKTINLADRQAVLEALKKLYGNEITDDLSKEGIQYEHGKEGRRESKGNSSDPS